MLSNAAPVLSSPVSSSLSPRDSSSLQHVQAMLQYSEKSGARSSLNAMVAALAASRALVQPPIQKRPKDSTRADESMAAESTTDGCETSADSSSVTGAGDAAKQAARLALDHAMDLIESSDLSIADPMMLALLQETLNNAWSVGLGRGKKAIKAAAILGFDPCECILDELRHAIGDAASAMDAVVSDIDMLQQVRSRLKECLATAKRCGVLGSELEDAENHRRRLTATIQDIKGQIRVFCRIRNMQTWEVGDAPSLKVIDASTVEVPGRGTFNFDRVFCPDAHGTQVEVFEECRDLVESALDGHNVTILAYGQTGAGKTYTMLGTEGNEGVAPRIISELFRLIESTSNHRQVEVSATMVEMYNNRLIDLSVGRRAETTRDGEIHETPVQDALEMQRMLFHGLAQRAVGANALNNVSSRSHFIFGIHVTTTNAMTGEKVKGKILLCDLAGAERLKRSLVEGERQKEAIEINKSLTALGDVIQAITKKYPQVPYRNHGLTRLLQDSIGGSAKTVMIVNCSPAACDRSESIMSLKYGTKASRIENRPSQVLRSKRP
jgi:hypothetical protein